MNIKLTPLVSAVVLALVATTPASFAKVYTAKTYNAELKAQLGKKKGAAAISTASTFIKKALTDPKNKALAATFSTSTVKALAKAVPAASKPNQAISLANAVTTGYFIKGAYDPKDSIYGKALTAVSRSITQQPQKTSANANKIANSVIKVKGSKNTSDNRGTIYATIYKALGLKNPPPS